MPKEIEAFENNSEGRISYDQILSWISEQNITIKEQQDENANFNIVISYPISSETPNMMRIIQPKEKKDAILIIDGIEIIEDHISSIKSLSDKARVKFLFEFRFLLGAQPIQFNMKVTPKNIMESFSVSKGIYGPLSKAKFFETLGIVYRAKLLGLWKIQDRFGMA